MSREDELRRITRGAGAAALVDPDGFAVALGKKLADVEGKGRLSGGLVAGGAVLGGCAVGGGTVGPWMGVGIIVGSLVLRGAGMLFRAMIP